MTLFYKIILITYFVFLFKVSYSVNWALNSPLNSNCESAIQICSDTIHQFNCDYKGVDLYYQLQIVNPNQVVNVEILNPSFVATTFDYVIIDFNGIDCSYSGTPTILSQANGVNFITYTFNSPGNYLLLVSTSRTDCPLVKIDFEGANTCSIPSIDTCQSCIGSFAPIPGSKYVITAWTKEEGAAPTKTSYTYPQLFIHFTIPDSVNSNSTIVVTEGPFSASGVIIDGWQRIESEFNIPIDAIDIEIELASSVGDVLFDDIRMFPFNASMKSFVYDPVNMRLAAELDERHYATFYEYDEEGKLVRIKKETERGIMTIQETKSNASK
jgi:hypothetical protein